MRPIDGYSWGMQVKLMLRGRKDVQLKHLRLLHRETVSLKAWVPLRHREQSYSKEDV